MFLVIFLSLDLNRTTSATSFLPEYKDILFAFDHSATDFRLRLICLFMSFQE